MLSLNRDFIVGSSGGMMKEGRDGGEHFLKTLRKISQIFKKIERGMNKRGRERLRVVQRAFTTKGKAR